MTFVLIELSDILFRILCKRNSFHNVISQNAMYVISIFKLTHGRITSVIDDGDKKLIVVNSGRTSYAVDIERRCQSRAQMDYLLLSQRLILSAVSKIDFQSR